MTPKQAAFIREYLIDRNATQAAIRAGYSEQTAFSIGCENLKKPNIAAALADAEAKLQAKAEMTVERVAQMLLDDRQMARELGQPSAAVTAAMGVAKLYGLLVDKVEAETVNTTYVISDTPEEVSSEEWIARHKPSGARNQDHKPH